MQIAAAFFAELSAFQKHFSPFDPIICIYTVWLAHVMPEHTGDLDMQN